MINNINFLKAIQNVFLVPDVYWMDDECNFKKVMRQETGIDNVHNLLSL